VNFLERINAVLHHQRPDQVPFAPFAHHLHRGDFEREMRNRGVGLCVGCGTVRAEQPNVRVETIPGDPLTTVYHTPVGSVSTSRKAHLSRMVGTIGSWQKSWLIEDSDDYAPVIFMIDDTIFYPAYDDYHCLVRDLGTDGIPYDRDGLDPPYVTTEGYFGLEQWAYEQIDHPDEFDELLSALARMMERKFPLVAASPAEFVAVGSLSGNYGPAQFEKYLLPFYQEYIPRLHAAGKICGVHAHNSNLKAFKDLIRQTGIDVVEAFTPPPVGDLSLAEAREAWGPQVVIWMNFPETIFYAGPEQTHLYTLNLLRSDPYPASLVIGFTEMGTSGIVDDQTEEVFKAGTRAVMDAIEEAADDLSQRGEPILDAHHSTGAAVLPMKTAKAVEGIVNNE